MRYTVKNGPKCSFSSKKGLFQYVIQNDHKLLFRRKNVILRYIVQNGPEFSFSYRKHHTVVCHLQWAPIVLPSKKCLVALCDMSSKIGPNYFFFKIKVIMRYIIRARIQFFFEQTSYSGISSKIGPICFRQKNVIPRNVVQNGAKLLFC